jgi:predicted NBD/HSP70 family sugar kinase
VSVLRKKYERRRERALMIHEVKHETAAGVLKCIHRGCKQTFTSATDLRQHVAKHFSKLVECSIACAIFQGVI